ncbi:MAG: hypothetical protein IJB96_11780 [Lachnospira sp.]|nr:hypothetical protein [Lachnospira sp.]
MEKYKSDNFIFYKAEQKNIQDGMYHRIRGVYEEQYQSDYHGLFVGQVATLFGSENTTSNNEDLISCAVAAESTDGDIIYLEVYYGPSGPAIGGQDGEIYSKAAEELEMIIRNTVPMDFETTSAYGDLGVSIKMGTRNGVGFYETVMDENLFAMLEKMYCNNEGE